MPKRKKPIKTRDHLMVRLINGATKAGAHQVKEEPELNTCRQCFHDYKAPTSGDDGFCSDTCAEQYEVELTGEEQ